MFKKVAVALVVLVAALAVVIAMRPSTFRVERSATMAAPAAVAYGLVNDFHQWPAWSPWEHLDPNMTKNFEGAPAGVGASYYWTGNDKVGEGRMTILENHPTDRVVIKLEFLKPWKAVSTITFTISPQGEGAKVDWAMEGTNNFMGKAFSLFMDMDTTIGRDFEKGLAQMKAAAEAEAKKREAEAAAAKAAEATKAAEAAKAAAEQAAQPTDGTAPAAAPAPKTP